MKKLVLAVLTAGSLLVGTANAETGLVHAIYVLNTGSVQVVLDIGGSGNPADLRYANIVGDAEKVKKILAVAMTAKSLGSEIYAHYGSGGWDSVGMLP